MDDRTTSRTTSTAGQTVNYTWTTDQIVNMVAVCRHNLSDAATIRVRTYSDTGMTSLIDDNTPLDAFNGTLLPAPFSMTDARFRNLKNSIYYLTRRTNVRAIKLDFADASNPDGYMEFARVLAGDYFQPAIGPEYGATMTQMTATTQSRMEGGDLRSDKRADWREAAVSLHAIKDSDDYDDWAALIQGLGMDRSTWIDLYEGAADTGTARALMNRMWCKVTSQGPFERHFYTLHRLPIKFGEC